MKGIATRSETVPQGPRWTEEYLGGALEEEERRIRAFAEQIREVQRLNARRAGGVARAFHAKTHAGLTAAEFRVSSSLDEDLRAGVFVPGATYPAAVRFSSAAGVRRPDGKRDLRGVAIRVLGETPQDFLLTNAPASHARDAAQFMAAAKAMTRSMPLAVVELVRTIGPRETVRMLRALRRATAHSVESLATESYWSRAPFALGRVAVKFKLAPAASPRGRRDDQSDAFLRRDLAARLREGPLVFPFQVQRFVNDRLTPIEDGSIEWLEDDAPPETIAELLIPQQDLASAEAARSEASVDGLIFSPWNGDGRIRPIGGLNRARKLVYEASAQHRS